MGRIHLHLTYLSTYLELREKSPCCVTWAYLIPGWVAHSGVMWGGPVATPAPPTVTPKKPPNPGACPKHRAL